jgi:hypothetical protein
MKTVTTVCTLPDETVTVTIPGFPLIVRTAVDVPVGAIVARLVGDAVHVSVGVAIVLPLVSTARTVNVTVVLGFTTSELGDDVTISVSSVAGAGGGGDGCVGVGTITVAVPTFPSLVAEIVTVPAPTAVTTPDVVTVAMLAALVDHAIARPVRTLPLASRVVATSVSDAPIESCEEAGVTATVATGTGAGAFTVICALPTFPSLVAVIVAVPAACAVTTPVALTLATCGALDAQTMLRPERALPLPS